MRIKLAAVFALLLLASPTLAAQKPGVPEVDRIRLAEAFRLGDALGNRVWQDWDKAPFAVLLVTPEYEFLVRHPKPSKDFTLIGYDSLLRSNIYFRARTQQTNFLATFPAVGGVSTIVVGQAENTQAKTSTPWVVTLLHEHFHQLQDSQPNSYAETEALNLSRGDRTGMWMLNYAFPYDSSEVREQFTILSKSLAGALQAKDRREFSRKLSAYFSARGRLRQMLSPDDYRYFSFQLWKEGVARYTQYHVARLAATQYRPSRAFRRLKDFTPFENEARAIRDGIIRELMTLRLESYRRVAFYAVGAGEGLLLDRANPKWRARYFAEKFYLENYFKRAR
jgi:hypothetical protein